MDYSYYSPPGKPSCRQASKTIMATALERFKLRCSFCIGSLSGEPRAWNSQALAEVAFLGLGDAIAYAGWDAAMRRGSPSSFSTATTSASVGAPS